MEEGLHRFYNTNELKLLRSTQWMLMPAFIYSIKRNANP